MNDRREPTEHCSSWFAVGTRPEDVNSFESNRPDETMLISQFTHILSLKKTEDLSGKIHREQCKER